MLLSTMLSGIALAFGVFFFLHWVPITTMFLTGLLIQVSPLTLIAFFWIRDVIADMEQTRRVFIFGIMAAVTEGEHIGASLIGAFISTQQCVIAAVLLYVVGVLCPMLFLLPESLNTPTSVERPTMVAAALAYMKTPSFMFQLISQKGHLFLMLMYMIPTFTNAFVVLNVQVYLRVLLGFDRQAFMTLAFFLSVCILISQVVVAGWMVRILGLKYAALFGFACLFLGHLVLSLATTTLQVYISICFALISGSLIPILRELLLKISTDDSYGLTLGSYVSISTFFSSLVGFSFSQLFAAFLTPKFGMDHPLVGLTFFCVAMLDILALLVAVFGWKDIEEMYQSVDCAREDEKAIATDTAGISMPA